MSSNLNFSNINSPKLTHVHNLPDPHPYPKNVNENNMEVHGASPEANLAPQDAHYLTNTSLPTYNLEHQTQDGFTNFGPRIEYELVEGLLDICGDPFVKDVPVYDVCHDPPPFSPEDNTVNSVDRARVLQAPVSSGNAAEANYMSLEIDEIQALKNMVERVKSVIGYANTIDKPTCSIYGYPFKSRVDFYRTCYQNGFLKVTSPLDERPSPSQRSVKVS